MQAVITTSNLEKVPYPVCDLDNENSLIAYKGLIEPNLITNLLEIIETLLDSFNDINKTKRKLYNVSVETLQNLYLHLDELPIEYKCDYNGKYAIFSVTKELGSYKLTTGNFIKKSNQLPLQKKIDFINSLKKEELKALQKEILNNPSYNSPCKNGLGLIDIAYRTKSTINYKFYNYNKDYSFFCLHVNIL